jgi:hypothetical protein
MSKTKKTRMTLKCNACGATDRTRRSIKLPDTGVCYRCGYKGKNFTLIRITTTESEHPMNERK